MKINALRFVADTEKGQFGFSFRFSDQLTIIRGGNSSGKSTFFNSLLYGLGMEELIGGKGVRALPYALKDHFLHEGKRIQIQSSRVWTELEGRDGQVATFCRSLRDELLDERLIQVCPGSVEDWSSSTARPLYLHDAGSAKYEDGFFTYLESFIGLRLPQVPATNGGTTKLYLQSVFAAFAVEQKRGWTDYIANIPYYGIRDPKRRVVEYLLDLQVFEAEAMRNRLNAESVAIDADWRALVEEITRASSMLGLRVEGVPRKPVPDLRADFLLLSSLHDDPARSVAEVVSGLRDEYAALGGRIGSDSGDAGRLKLEAIERKRAELLELTAAYEQISSEAELRRVSLRDYEGLLNDIQDDLVRNKAAKKLKTLGAEHELSVSRDVCPTCSQPIPDSLFLESFAGLQMNLEDNIEYLDSQRRMLERQVAGTKERLLELARILVDSKRRLANKHDEVLALRTGLSEGDRDAKASMRRQVQIEVEVESLQRLADEADRVSIAFKALAERVRSNRLARRELPAQGYSDSDERRLGLFEKLFRANAGSFGYASASIADIKINRESLTPFLEQLELREIRQDVRSDSSASDFVRLIWSYLLALYQASSSEFVSGNHVGTILFDEPGQHSMAEDSQRALLRMLASEGGLQSIVAASFDESESVFKNATDGVRHKLIDWSGKLIRPMEG